MSSSAASGGIKRSATAADYWRPASSAATSGRRSSKRHRPSKSNTKSKSFVEGINHLTEPTKADGGLFKILPPDFHLDLIGKIAKFVATGQSLMNLLVALGPVESQQMRRDYLRNNDAYLVQSLGICRRAMAPAIRLRQPNSSNVLNLYQLSAKRFNKCRDNIQAWMDINANWRSRCTQANMTKYYRRPIQGANLIFNNPVVAIEVGLVDVLGHLINEMDADVCDTDCKGFVADAASSHRGMDNFVFNPIVVALYRRDTEMLHLILSARTFRVGTSADANRLLSQWDILNYCYKQKKIRMDAFETLIASPQIDVNTTHRDVHCLHRFVFNLFEFIDILDHRDDGVAEFILSRISALLKAGSNPHARSDGDIIASSAYKFAEVVATTFKGRKGGSPFDEWRCAFWDRLMMKIEESEN